MAHSRDIYLKTDQDFFIEITIGTAEQGLGKKMYAEGFTLHLHIIQICLVLTTEMIRYILHGFKWHVGLGIVLIFLSISILLIDSDSFRFPV